MIESRIELIRKTKYITTDGKEFKSMKEAEVHEFRTMYDVVPIKIEIGEKEKLSTYIDRLIKLRNKYGETAYIEGRPIARYNGDTSAPKLYFLKIGS
jgi:hypothetical protein